jgi:hypothetical protein
LFLLYRWNSIGSILSRRILQVDKSRSRNWSADDLIIPVYTIEHSQETSLLSGTPQTLVITNDGKIIKNWFGAYAGKLQIELEQYFQLKLPGLISDEDADDSANIGDGKLGCHANE